MCAAIRKINMAIKDEVQSAPQKWKVYFHRMIPCGNDLEFQYRATK